MVWKSFLKKGSRFSIWCLFEQPVHFSLHKKVHKLSHQKHLANKTPSMVFCCCSIYKSELTLKNEKVNLKRWNIKFIILVNLLKSQPAFLNLNNLFSEHIYSSMLNIFLSPCFLVFLSLSHKPYLSPMFSFGRNGKWHYFPWSRDLNVVNSALEESILSLWQLLFKG